jgi:hypothetical protein
LRSSRQSDTDAEPLRLNWTGAIAIDRLDTWIEGAGEWLEQLWGQSLIRASGWRAALAHRLSEDSA